MKNIQQQQYAIADLAVCCNCNAHIILPEWLHLKPMIVNSMLWWGWTRITVGTYICYNNGGYSFLQTILAWSFMVLMNLVLKLQLWLKLSFLYFYWKEISMFPVFFYLMQPTLIRIKAYQQVSTNYFQAPYAYYDMWLVVIYNNKFLYQKFEKNIR